MGSVQGIPSQQNTSAGIIALLAHHAADLRARLEILVAQQRIRLVMFDGAAGVMIQANDGPCLYVSHKDPTDVIQRNRAIWQLRAFLDALEASEA